VYAIVKAGGRQEKVQEGDVIELDRVQAEVGQSIDLPVVLLVNNGAVTADGLDKASVKAELLEHFRGPKIDILRYKNKTGYRRRQGHRSELSRVKITKISAGK
jgi:large subunit ribosomal protein L21